MMELLEAIDELTGSDLATLGVISMPSLDTRVPGQPLYSLIPNSITPFTIYWGYRYDEDGKVIPLQQDVNTGQRYGLTSRDQDGRSVILNGLRVLFYSEKLHSSCKVVEAGAEGHGYVRTGSMEEAIQFLCKIRPEWIGFIEQSVLTDLITIRSRDNTEMWGQNIRRRLLEVTKVNGASDEIVNLDPAAEPEEEEVLASAPTMPIAGDPRANMPDWPKDQFLSASEELLNPPTRQDRPLLVQLKIGVEQVFKHAGPTVLSEVQRNAIKSHAGYWARVISHRSQDIHTVQHCADGIEMVVGLKVTVNAGLDSKNRWHWLENTFNALKLQIETGTPPKKSDGKTTVPKVDGVTVYAVRCAYP